MGHLSQVNAQALFDADLNGGELEIRGTTDNAPGGPPPPIAIHVAVVQQTADGTVAAAGNAAVPPGRLADPDWETRVNGSFEEGAATVFGQALEFRADAGAFETFVWAQAITIEPGELQPDDPLT